MLMRKWWAIGLVIMPAMAHADYPTFSHLSSGIIYAGPITQFNPGSTKATNGDLLVQFNSGSDQWPGEKAYLIRSTDEGLTWGQPEMLVQSTMTYAQGVGIGTTVGITTLKDGTIILPFIEGKLNDGWAENPPLWTDVQWAHAYVIMSHDNGHTWSAWISVGGFQNSVPFGQIVERANGDLLLALWTRDSWGTVVKAPNQHSGYVISHDHGQTWGELTDFDLTTGETSLLEFPDTSLLGVGKLGVFKRNTGNGWERINTGPFRAGKSASLYLSPHGFPIVTYSNVPSHLAYSPDSGARWYDGYVFDPYIPSINPAHHTYGLSAINLDSHRIMIVYFALDPNRPAGSNFLVQNTYLAYEILDETINSGNPPGLALSDPPLGPPSQNQPNVEVTPNIHAYPCPWRSDQHTGKPIKFSNADNIAIKIYTVSAHLVKTITNGQWDLTNDNGQNVASGLYLFQAGSQIGKLAIIR